MKRKGFFMKKLFKLILSVLLMLTCVSSNLKIEQLFAYESNQYPVLEDAYIRSGSNASKNYNYENITSAHGSQYVGKDYKVINAKFYGGAYIIPVMKFNLPTKEEVSENGYDTYRFNFNIFKNPDFNNGDQIYHFYYITDNEWSETGITYNSKPETMTNAANLLFDFTILKGTQYETMSDEDKHISFDITDKVKTLVEADVQQITVFAIPESDKQLSLMLHSKESADGSKGAYIEATSEHRTIYAVSADNYIRNGSNASKTYNYENITSAHGSQYVGKNYKVLNTKYDGSTFIATVMKLSLPSKEEVEAKGLNQFHFEYHIFKNADPSTGDQTYEFKYVAGTDWTESNVTYNNIAADVRNNTGKALFNLNITKDFAYETKGWDIQRQSVDITSTVLSLIEQGVNEITIYTNAVNSMNTSLMIHSKESADGSFVPRLVATSQSCDKTLLQNLVNEASNLKEASYTNESYQKVVVAKEAAQQLLDDENASGQQLYSAYITLKNAIDTLEENTELNIALDKPTRSNLNKTKAYLVTDGDVSTSWTGKFYPSYVDIDLMDTYDLSEVEVYFQSGKMVWFSLYGSNDGEHYDELYESRSEELTTSDPMKITFDEVESYRILRVYVEFVKGADSAHLNEVKVMGTKTNTNETVLRDGSLEEILEMKAYEETDYAKPITNEETIENVYGIIDRVIGEEYRDWFTFELGESTNYDYFELSDVDGKVHIKGNEGLSLARGVNHYLKYYAHVLVSQQTISGTMPSQIVPIGEVVRKETPYSVRYAYNYCTLSYTYAFYGEEEWQRENDWLALSGVNVVLDLAGQEATWIKFLMNFGYSFDDAKDWLTGPAYYAWQFMDNMESFGGPVPDDYVVDRVELARKSQRWKNSLGMQTILQGYAGMVPTNFKEYQSDVEIITQGSWNGFARPDMIATDSETYDEYAALFYEAQEFVYGTRNHYYAVDPFHEGGKRPSDLTDDMISKEVLESMIGYDKDAVWVVQGWQSNPTNALLKGMEAYREDHVLIVDLIKYPIASATKYDNTSYGSTTLDETEFNHTPWAWTLLGNFGGNPTFNAQLEVMVNDILKAQANTQYMSGLGIISEATNDNPMVYALIFDLAWADEDFNLNQWMKDYFISRYGSVTENVLEAWGLIKDTAYDHGVRFTAEVYGTKNSVPQSYGSKTISYGAENLETALRLLLLDYDKYQNNEGYRYDLTEIMRQQVSNYSVLVHNDLLTAINNKDLDMFLVKKAEFINSLEVLNAVQATQQDQLGGEWIGKAQDRSATYDDFSQKAFEMNAKTLITTWGSYAGFRLLKDYGWRNYEGIFNDIYAANWIEYLDRVEANLKDGTALNNLSLNDYFPVYWKWVMSDQDYLRDAKDSPEEIQAISTRVLSECALSDGLDPNVGNLALNGMANATNKDTYDAKTVCDGDKKTALIVDKDEDCSAVVDLIAQFNFSSVQVVFGDDTSPSDVQVYVSNDMQEWKLLNGQASDETNTYVYKGCDDTYRYIKVDTSLDSMNLKEVRAYGERMLPTLAQLETYVDSASTLKYIGSESEVNTFKEALKAAQEGVDTEAAPDEVNSLYWTLYDAMKQLTLSEYENIAINKPVTAHNDPSGNSARLTNGVLTESWDAGRLSITGKPYESTITEGWAIVDLENYYDLKEIILTFKTGNYWHKYEVYTSVDSVEWDFVGSKMTTTPPNVTEDTYRTNHIARYIKVQLKDVEEADGMRVGIKVGELEAYGKLHTIDKSELQAMIDLTQMIYDANNSENMYKPASFETFKEAFETAIAVNSKGYATENEVKVATDDLSNAYQALQSQIVQVTNLSATATNYKTITLTWDAYQDATSYVVERLTSDGEWMEVATTTEPAYTHVGVKTGKAYTYRVKADNSEYSETVSATPMLVGEVELTLTGNGSTKFDLTWTSVEGATRYIIYRKAKTSEWKKVLTLGKDATTYTSKDMAEGTYTYQVKAARYDSVDRVMTNGSNEVVGIIGKVNPTLTITEENGTSVTLAWDKVPCMKYYEVYRAKDGGAYRQVKRTTNTSVTSTSLKAGSTYTYKVRAFNLSNDTKVYTDFSNEVSYTVQ